MTFENAFLGQYGHNTNTDNASSTISKALEDSEYLYSLATIQKLIKRTKKAMAPVFFDGFWRPGPPTLLSNPGKENC